MIMTLVNITGSTLTYLSGAVSVAANSALGITDITLQVYLAIDGQLNSDILNGYLQISDGISNHATLDAASYLQLLLRNSNPMGVSEASIYARAGQMFNVATNLLSPGTIAETPILLVSNPGGSGKSMRLKYVSLDAPFFAGEAVVYRVYGIPSGSITANGTALTPSGARQTGQASPAVNVYKLPTVSANGVFLGAKVVSFGSNVEVDYDFSQFVEPGFNILVTATLSQSNGTCGLFLRYAEEA
jgi:hypothetical protein